MFDASLAKNGTAGAVSEPDIIGVSGSV